ncbi:U3-containing 90S pre-ribosomal complex subunit-domain containing protein [Hypomontagnella monticulosa]|nr:U3-containing 90S pre-ribosomal complex subunit-domain containing protein [Hypomontagnella monticulosa]
MRHKRRVHGPSGSRREREKRRRVTEERAEEDQEFLDCILNPVLGEYQKMSTDDIALRWRQQCDKFFKNAYTNNVPIDAKAEDWYLVRVYDPVTKFKVFHLEKFVRRHTFQEIWDHEKKMPPHDKKGAPYCIVVVASARRACLVLNTLRDKDNPLHMAKLFAKHLKLEDTVNHLKTHHVDVGVGTPARLLALTECGALDVSLLRCIVIHASWPNRKDLYMMDMMETFMPMARWLAHPKIRERMKEREEMVCFA